MQSIEEGGRKAAFSLTVLVSLPDQTLLDRAWLEQIGQVCRIARIAQPGIAMRRTDAKDFLHGAQER